jgi:hypothetical protein
MRPIMAGFLSALWMGMIATSAFAGAQAVSALPQTGKSIVFARVGPVDPALLDRVARFANENTDLKIRLLPEMKTAGDTLDALGVSASRAMKPEDAALVILTAPSADSPTHKAILLESRVAVVNVQSLKPSNGDAETWGRRVEREVMQSIGLLMGVPTCPNPQCVMFQHATDNELDAKGRNYCPPCSDGIRNAAKDKGIDVKKPMIGP